MKKYTVLSPIEVGDVIHHAGATVELTDEQAKPYLHCLRLQTNEE